MTIPVLVLTGLLCSLAFYKAFAFQFLFPQAIIDTFPFVDWSNEDRVWLEANLKVYSGALACLCCRVCGYSVNNTW